MEERIWSNPEMKGTYFKMAITAIIFSVLAVFYFGSLFGNYNKGLIDKNIATAGILIQKHPELKDDIIMAFTSEAGMKELQSGIAAAVEYGYTDKLPISVMPLINHYYITSIINIVVFSLLCFMFAGFIMYFFKKKIYQRVRETANAAERIIEGDFNIKLNEQDEGDFSKLGHQFNQMAKRL
jgi:methyl-accepting chemotaxis protein